MARLKFSKVTERYTDYRNYQQWLEANSYPFFCGYSWLINQPISIDHYKPKEHFPKLEANPDNLIPCTTHCNSFKSDYHPQVKNRRVYREYSEKIFNYREEDIGKYVKVESNGRLTYVSLSNKSRFNFNEKVFKYNRYNNQEMRKNYLTFLDTLIEIYDCMQIAKKENNMKFFKFFIQKLEFFKELCSKHLIFYKLFNIKIPKHIEKLLTNKTEAVFK